MRVRNDQATGPLGTLPPGYREVLYWKITGQASRMVRLQFAALPLLAAACLLFYGLAVWLGRLPLRLSFTGRGALLTLGSALGIMILHELVHGLAMQVCGARPEYGILWKEAMLYATAPGHAFRRGQYLFIALALLVSLSLLITLGIALLAGSPWVAPLAVGGALNAAGAVGDLWISAVVLPYPAHAYVVDERDGVRIFLPEAEAQN